MGLPGFQFIQDPLDYGTITHHSDMDTYDHAVAADLMQASAVIATVVYETANRARRCCRGAHCRRRNRRAGAGKSGTIGFFLRIFSV